MLGNLDDARSFFNARVVQVAGDEALRWAWDHLRPEAVQSLDVGSGLDVGYVRGFYGPEKYAPSGQAFRWSKDVAEVRGIPGGVCELQWSGWRPSGLPDAKVTFTHQIAPGIAPFQIQPEPAFLPNKAEWTTTELDPFLSQRATGLELAVNSFVVSGSDPRLVGVQLSKVVACQR
jgi:hypothetical protein